jgi:hypothetical protein
LRRRSLPGLGAGEGEDLAVEGAQVVPQELALAAHVLQQDVVSPIVVMGREVTGDICCPQIGTASSTVL